MDIKKKYLAVTNMTFLMFCGSRGTAFFFAKGQKFHKEDVTLQDLHPFEMADEEWVIEALSLDDSWVNMPSTADDDGIPF